MTVARPEGIDVAYLPVLAMRRAADLYPGSTKTDAIDAFVIAETAPLDAAHAAPRRHRR